MKYSKLLVTLLSSITCNNYASASYTNLLRGILPESQSQYQTSDGIISFVDKNARISCIQPRTIQDDNNNDDDSGSSDRSWIEDFEELCSAEDLSIEEIHRMTVFDLSTAEDDLHKSSFLHRVCMNKLVTLEIVEYLIDLCPRAINQCMDITDVYPEVESAYPLHLACYNKECPNEVIQLLLEKGGNFILHMIYCMDYDWSKRGIDVVFHDDGAGGTPLHFYLSRTSNVNLDIVKRIVTANPDALLSFSGYTKSTPTHILMNNKSIGEMFDVVEYIVESNPSSLRMKDRYDQTPLHVACTNGYITTRPLKFLLSVWAGALHERNDCSAFPIHLLCEKNERGKEIDDEVAIDILKLFLQVQPDLVSQTDDSEDNEQLPLHLAADNKSKAFCKVLVDAYPESVKIRGSGDGCLPFHHACNNGRIETFLLKHDPECASKPTVGEYRSWPLHLVSNTFDKSNVTELLFDIYPEAILLRNEREQLPIDVLRRNDEGLPLDPDTGEPYAKEYRQRNQKLITFLGDQMWYARKAQDETAMRTPDSAGFLPLHNALYASAPIGSIKLLVKGYPNSIRMPDRSGMYPLDIAIQYSTLGVVKYLAELSPDLLNACDSKNNYLLHHACCWGNCEVIHYLLETPMNSVSERNVVGMLPIHLFCEFVNEQDDAEDTTGYTETIWRLLTAYPETVLNW